MPRAASVHAPAFVVLALLLAGLIPAPASGRLAEPIADVTVCPSCAITSLADAIANAQPGDRIAVQGGVYSGGLTVDKPVELIGIDSPVIDGNDSGSLVHGVGVDFSISGFVLRNTGSSHDQEDAAIVVDGGAATIERNRIENALFGIYLKLAHKSVVRDNVVLGKAVEIAMRGDGIKIWYSDDVIVEGNQASDGRDVILWYSNRGTIRNNQFDRERYGLHLMFSNDVTIESNSLRSNSIGVFIMYSRNISVVGNSLSNNHGPSGGGIGLKDVDNLTVEANRFVNNQIAAQIDNSPTAGTYENVWRDNVFAFNDTGLGFMPSVRFNTFTGNSFVDNAQHMAILGRGRLKDVSWSLDGVGNYWSDYAGFDADGDGIGDIPYRSEQLFESLTDRHPSLRLFLFSPSAMAIDFAARAFPGVRPEIKLEDTAPLIAPRQSPLLPAVDAMSGGARIATGAIGIVMLAGSVALIALLRPKRRRLQLSTHLALGGVHP